MMQKMKYGVSAMRRFTLLSLICGLSACSEAKTNSEHHASQKVSNMKIQIEIEGSTQPIFANLTASPATQDFIKQLPLSLKLTDYASSEKIAYLPQRLTTQGATSKYAGRSGDLTYYAPWGNLAIFYKNYDGGNGLIFLGRIENLPKEFSGDKPLNVTISSVSK